MSHPSSDKLTLIALGEPDDGSVARHVRDCDRCADELASLRKVTDLARASRDDQELPEPPAGMWERIAEQTGVAPRLALAPDPGTGSLAGVAPPSRSRPRRRWALTAAAVVAAIVLGAGVTVGAQQLRSAGTSVVATASLVPTTAAPAQARGEVSVVSRSGKKSLKVSLKGMPETSGLYEVWLFDGHATMIPVGVLNNGSVELPVPTSISLGRFSIVDVSLQRVGQAAHGQSMLRGRLRE
ncbi:hypothetical protein Athai_14610 [Actinocatenispora thailandica]|uniref:Anti-sigma K factor RskA C-terminal domain-containing protein n=1 Tax=Actinocatenispora thailandica TaxID=227318 RepID=A0A7R7DLS2_9ACTN|nr:anti-sigma factor [Actinocatenispora thailandica]BCJ33958.1 hypothetical protein Athai_14610 [Actinocatenispora thailandica]